MNTIFQICGYNVKWLTMGHVETKTCDSGFWTFIGTHTAYQKFHCAHFLTLCVCV